MERKHNTILNSQTIRQLIQEVVDNKDQTKDDLLRHLEFTDLRIADMVQLNPFVAASRHHTLCNRLEVMTPKIAKSPHLIIPKGNTLTDSLLKTTLGCEEKLAKEYADICRKHSCQEVKQASVADIKKRFADSNSFQDFYANTKAQTTYSSSKPKPLIDNQHEDYLKTQLIFLQKPKTLNQTLTYHTKRFKNVANKIEQLGGIEDTLKNMQQSLKSNQMDELKRNQTYEVEFGKSSASFNPRSNSASIVFDKLSQSRQMRSALQGRYHT